MPRLTPEGEKVIAALAERYAVSVDAVKLMLDAVAKGGGSMAQFNVPEFGGSGQWMRGGMTMVGDMFNNSLKATVDNLCNELSNLLARQPGIVSLATQTQSQSQGSGGGIVSEGASLFVPQSSYQSGIWWPSELGSAAATGAQNSLRYAYFPMSRRLAVDYGGRIEIYDTLDHNIQGFGQQQSGDASLTINSQYGVFRVDSLPRADGGHQSPKPAVGASAPAAKIPPQPSSGSDASSIVSLIEQLGHLKELGILTDEEFATKKAELLKRL